jgi:hypothetical protein
MTRRYYKQFDSYKGKNISNVHVPEKPNLLKLVQKKLRTWKVIYLVQIQDQNVSPDLKYFTSEFHPAFEAQVLLIVLVFLGRHNKIP